MHGGKAASRRVGALLSRGYSSTRRHGGRNESNERQGTGGRRQAGRDWSAVSEHVEGRRRSTTTRRRRERERERKGRAEGSGIKGRRAAVHVRARVRVARPALHGHRTARRTGGGAGSPQPHRVHHRHPKNAVARGSTAFGSSSGSLHRPGPLIDPWPWP